jgi:hypothetical protein
MKSIIAVLQLLPAIIAAVRTVEEAIPLPGQGKAKLDLIIGIIQDTGEDVGAILPLITKTIARIVGTFNAIGIFKK